jgi:MarR family transcriptional regulator, 2-MHQ and catechol-resistance regulon repressor
MAAKVSSSPAAVRLRPENESDYLDLKMTTDPAVLDPSIQDNTETALKLWVVLNRASRAITDRIRGSIERHDLSLSEFGVLEVLYSKGRMLVGELGSKILLTSGSTTYVVDKLEARGLVVRRPCPDDRRALHVELTEKGRQLIAGIFPQHAQEVRRAMGGLTDEEQRIATAMLKRLGRYAEDGR